MPSVVEVSVPDAVSPEDAASLEKDDAPPEPDPPKDVTVSFADSVTRTANVYASSRPPSRRGVSSADGRARPKTSGCARKTTRRGVSGGVGFGGSLPSALERDPALRRLHEETRAARSLAKTYKAKLTLAERAADAYRSASFAAEARATRVETAAERLLGGAFETSGGARRALRRLGAEREASARKLEACERELLELRRANATLRRAREADRKTFRNSEKALAERLDAAKADSASLREEIDDRRRDLRRAAIEARALEAKLSLAGPNPPSRAVRHARDRSASANAARDARDASARSDATPEPAPEPNGWPPSSRPGEAEAEEERAREANAEANAEAKAEAKAEAEDARDDPSSSGSSSGGGGDADGLRVLVCVVCVEPERVSAPPGPEGPSPPAREGDPSVSNASTRVSDATLTADDDACSTRVVESRTDRPDDAGANDANDASDASDADDATPKPRDETFARTSCGVAKEKQPRDQFFFARTTVASRSRAGTLTLS